MDNDQSAVFLKQLNLKNVLSFGDLTSLDFKPLTVLIGPNASGKSNLLSVISLFQGMPADLTAPIRDGGGIAEWIWKGNPKNPIHLDGIFQFTQSHHSRTIHHHLALKQSGLTADVIDEKIENKEPEQGRRVPYLFFEYKAGHATINQLNLNNGSAAAQNRKRGLKSDTYNPAQSVLAQRKDPEQYPEITRLGELYKQIHIYRDWQSGGLTKARMPCRADAPGDFLAEDFSNLGMMLNRLRTIGSVRGEMEKNLNHLYENARDFDIQVQGGLLEVYLLETGPRGVDFKIPATRMSDGILHWLALLMILLHPTPPPLVCLEEPEIGLHPDMIHSLAELLIKASERMQIIVTTHSDLLVDALRDQPESIVVCVKEDGQTRMKRLEPEILDKWLDQYTLSELWLKGELGGVRY